jgi:hypothetical protein
MRRGYFERESDREGPPVYRLRWLPENELDERERRYAQFVRYLIAVGRLSEATEQINR